MAVNLDDQNLPVYTIGVAAKLVETSVHSLRLYETVGLLSPKRTETQRRLYSQNDINRLKCIRNFIEVEGLNLAGIKTALSLVPCWQIKECSTEDREKCDAYYKIGEPCWIVKNRGDLCTEVDCRDCEVYLSVGKCSNIKELIKSATTK